MGERPKSQQAGRDAKKIAHIRQVTLSGSRNDESIFASLRATQALTSKPVLPAELLAVILEHVAIPDLMRFARVSSRMKEMVYDDTRWIQKLRAIGVWNESEARQRFEQVLKRRADAQRAKEAEARMSTGTDFARGNKGHATGTVLAQSSLTLFDAGVEAEKYRRSLEQTTAPNSRHRSTLQDGFDDLTTSSASNRWDSTIALSALSRVRSIRGYARQEFGKLYASLNPLYSDLARVEGHSSSLLFRYFQEPEQQAQVLNALHRFARGDTAQGWEYRQQRLDASMKVFENAAMREFEYGFNAGDIDGKMHRYAHVLATLNGGRVCLEYFVSHHPALTRDMRVGNPMDCLEGVAPGHVDLNSSQNFFQRLTVIAVEQADVIDRVFPPEVDPLTLLLSRLALDIVNEYLTVLFDEAHNKGIEPYVKAVSGTFAQSLRMVASIKPTRGSSSDLPETFKQDLTSCFEKHIDLYLAEELGLFRSRAKAEVTEWEKALSEQEATAESFFMSNINRQAAKRDFLSSFKKVVMMPVNALPTMSSPFAIARPASVGQMPANLESVDTSYSGARLRSQTTTTSGTPLRPGTPQSGQEAPTNELSAKAAIMSSRLEGIKSLFSIEVALNLTHLAKASIERMAIMVRMGSSHGADAKVQCGSIFVALLNVLGERHVRQGFDKAVKHLGDYDPQQVRQFRDKALKGEDASKAQIVGVEPLVTFLELVNVGDLIQQMLDVFYAQELVATQLNDRDDFLDPTVKEKKRFEQMLDERVAAGLNKGIDVLMDEVEYLCATTQKPTDFNPGSDGASSNGAPQIMDIGPSTTAKQVVDMVGSHTSMLVGSTDKNMLDVFTQEVGLRLYGVLCKHFKRQRISVDGSIKLISDINHYSAFVATLRQKQLQPYFQALRELSQIYLIHIDPPTTLFATNASGKRGSLLSSSSKSSKTASQAKELATIIADAQRYHGILGAEEVYEFAQRRADWYLVKSDVERAMYGVGCSVM